MLTHKMSKLLVLVLLGINGVSRDVNGESVRNSLEGKPTVSEERLVTLQDLKEYIQPILYQKYLRTPGDSLVLQQAKAVVSEYLADSLVSSVKNVSESIPESHLKPVSKQQGIGSSNQATNTITSAGASLIQAVTGGVSGNRNRTRPTQQHVFNQVDSIINNVNGGNITGIVDQALLIRASPPVRRLVNGILNSVFCNPLNRLWNRCPGGGSLLFGDML